MKYKYLLAMIFVCGLIFSLFQRKAVKQEDTNSKDTFARSKNSKKQYAVGGNAKDQSQIIHAPKNTVSARDRAIDEELDNLEGDFAKADQTWMNQVKSKFKELGLSSESFSDYLSMREDFEKDALDKLEDFHLSQEAKKGKDYTYRITEFDDKVMNDLRKQYHEKLAKVIGEEAMREFIKLRDEFNEQQKRSNPDVTEDISIDF